MKVVTYATHYEGTLKKLVNNDFNVHVEVLGMGKKWNGFNDKLMGVMDFCKKLEPDEIVVFVDGFDSIIHRSPDNVEREFKKMNCGLLFSSVSSYNIPLFDLFVFRMFGTCNTHGIANSGLYMGYAKYIIDFITKALENATGDDQKDVNNTCEKVNYVCVDEKCKFFKNLNGGSADDKKFISRCRSTFCKFSGPNDLFQIKKKSKRIL